MESQPLRRDAKIKVRMLLRDETQDSRDHPLLPTAVHVAALVQRPASQKTNGGASI
jgi:hypothetical protein